MPAKQSSRRCQSGARRDGSYPPQSRLCEGPAFAIRGGRIQARILTVDVKQGVGKKAKTANLVARAIPIALLICSNVFMTFGWYGHLRFKDRALWFVILASWGIAFFEYCLAVPANRWGSAVYTPAELKAIQELVTLWVFVAFSFFYLGQKITAIQGVGFALIVSGACLVFLGSVTAVS
jgi:hypothetical protein